MTEKRQFLSLRSRFVIMLVLAVALALVFGAVTSLVGRGLIENVYLSNDACEKRCRAILDEFETFVSEEELNVAQAREITRWAKEQGYLYLLVSDEKRVLVDSGWWDEMEYYSVFDTEGAPEEGTSETGNTASKIPAFDLTPAEEAESAVGTASGYTESYSFGAGSRPMAFQDGTYLVSVYDFSDEPLYEAVDIAVLVIMLVVLFGVMIGYHNSVTRRIIALSQEVKSIAGGNLTDRITVHQGDEIGELANHVDMMRYAIIKEMRAEQEAWSANSDLITRMSHDIRTPLTVLIGFLELLEEGEISSDEAYQDYLGICKKNAFQMKALADKLFQYFLVFGQGANKITLEIADAKVLLHQLLGEHTVLLQEQGWMLHSEADGVEGMIEVDPVHMKRLFDNVFSNIEKYADQEQPVEIRLWREADTLRVTIQNGIRQEPNLVESTNMGLKTCERIAELMKGSFRCEKSEESFAVILSLPICE